MSALCACGKGRLVRLAAPIAREAEDALRRGDASGGARRCESVRAATYEAIAGAIEAFGANAAGDALAAAAIPHAQRDAIAAEGCSDASNKAGERVGTVGGNVVGKRKNATPYKRKRFAGKKGGAWGAAGEDEMAAYLAATEDGSLPAPALFPPASETRMKALRVVEAALVHAGAALRPRLRAACDRAAASAAELCAEATDAPHGSDAARFAGPVARPREKSGVRRPPRVRARAVDVQTAERLAALCFDARR